MAEESKRNDSYRELRVLEEIERNPRVSQRQLATELGVALGVANACVRTLARKGMLKVRGESNRSLSYHLTKQGVLHKASLALEWTNNTIGDYVQARARMRQQLESLASAGVKTVVLLGADEVAELVALIAPQAGITVKAAIPLQGRRIANHLAGVPVIEPVDLELSGVDAALLLGGRALIAEMHLDLSGTPILNLNGERLEGSVL